MDPRPSSLGAVFTPITIFKLRSFKFRVARITYFEIAFREAFGTNAQGSNFCDIGGHGDHTINIINNLNTNDTAAKQLPTKTAPSQDHQPDPLYKLMPLSSRIFTGRKDYLDRLEQYFGREIDRPQRRKHFLLYGLGGTGKSQICLNFIEQSGDR